MKSASVLVVDRIYSDSILYFAEWKVSSYFCIGCARSGKAISSRSIHGHDRDCPLCSGLEPALSEATCVQDGHAPRDSLRSRTIRSVIITCSLEKQERYLDSLKLLKLRR